MTFKEIMQAVDSASQAEAFEIAGKLLGEYNGSDLDLIKSAVYEAAARRVDPELV